MAGLIPSPYQLVHLMKLRSNGMNSLLIADGVGVGKTISSGYIIYHQSMVSRKPVLIVCPPILIEKWREELRSKFGIFSRLANKQEGFQLMMDEIGSRRSWDSGPVYLTTYTLLSRLESAQIPNVGLTVMDEIHSIRNPNTKAYPILRSICERSDFRVGLSATPINNSVSDLASILSVLLVDHKFEVMDSLLDDLWGLPAMDCMNSLVTRFRKEDVSSHFTRRSVTSEEMHFPDEYSSFVSEEISRRFPWSEDITLSTISTHRLAASSPPAFFKAMGIKEKTKIRDPKLERFQQIIGRKSSERWLVFTEFKETARYLADSIEGRLVLTMSGESSQEEREANAFLFKETEGSVMVMTPVGSEGLDFQFCSNLINYDLHWNPMRIEQRIGRIDRIGQNKEVVNVHNFHVVGSVDENVRNIMGDKLAMVSGTFADIPAIVDSKFAISGSPVGQSVIEHERRIADSMIKSANFYNNISSNDLAVCSEIDEVNCLIDDWGDHSWSDPFPWSENCQDWHTELSQESGELRRLLDSYSE